MLAYVKVHAQHAMFFTIKAVFFLLLWRSGHNDLCLYCTSMGVKSYYWPRHKIIIQVEEIKQLYKYS
jgi:hypothetical protein